MKPTCKTRPAASSGDDPGEPPRPSPLGPLGRLLDRIGRAGAGGSSDSRLASWEDDEFLYLEDTLPDIPGEAIDVSVIDGRVFIRIGKPARSSGRIARPAREAGPPRAPGAGGRAR